MHHKCHVVSGIEIQCDLRFANPWEAPGSPEKVEILWPDGERKTVQFDAYNPNENTTAWLLLVDRSKSLSKESVQVIQEDFGRIISGLRSKEKLGIATFAENFQLHTHIGVQRDRLLSVLNEIKPVGSKTFLYKSAIDGLEVLRDMKAERKALVIISDGRSEDTPEYTYQGVIKRAKELGIVVYGIGYSQDPKNDFHLNDLQQIAIRTQGPWQKELLYKADSRVLSPRMMQYFLDFMQNGGRAKFPHHLPGKEVTAKIIATMSDGEEFRTQMEIPFVEAPKPVPVPVPVVVTAPVEASGILGLPKDYDVLIISIVGGSLVFLLLALLFWILKRGASDEEENEDSDIYAEGEDRPTEFVEGEETTGDQKEPAQINGDAGDHDTVYASLEQLGDSSKRIELNRTTMSVGRHKDNDIQFLSSTVHRRHATLHMNAEKTFIITDLSGENGNGISINGDRITTAQLKTGDLIELGDVRLRFIEGHPG